MDNNITNIFADPFTYTLSYEDDFYYMCDMPDRTILIQRIDETDIQFDARFKDTRNCYSYKITLSPYDYNILKNNDCDFACLRTFVEQCIIRSLFNYVDEPMVNTLKNYLGNDTCRKSFKTSESISVETNVHYFTMQMSRFNQDDYVPYEYENSFILDSAKKQIYVKKNKITNFLDGIFDPVKFTECKIKIYSSLTNNDFKCIIDNGLLGTVLCYSENILSVYDNTFGDIKVYNGDYAYLCGIILDIIKDVIVSEPSSLMQSYASEYNIDIDTITSEQLKMFVIADY